jgi:hypothetical protein
MLKCGLLLNCSNFSNLRYILIRGDENLPDAKRQKAGSTPALPGPRTAGRFGLHKGIWIKLKSGFNGQSDADSDATLSHFPIAFTFFAYMPSSTTKHILDFMIIYLKKKIDKVNLMYKQISKKSIKSLKGKEIEREKRNG